MKKVIIRWGSDYNLLNNCHIIIFDRNNYKVFDEYIKNNKVVVYLNKDVYKIIIIPFDIVSCTLSTSFLVTDKNNCFNFSFIRNDNSLKITAILVDKNYNNLPIERGEIKLWQNHI